MNDKRHLLVASSVLAIIVLVGGLAAVTATDHQNEDVDYDTDNMSDVSVPYGNGLDATGSEVNPGDTYSVERYNPQNAAWEFVMVKDADSSGNLMVDTEKVDQEVGLEDPRGQYRVAEPLPPQFSASDHESDGNYTVVDEFYTEQDVKVNVYDENGNLVGEAMVSGPLKYTEFDNLVVELDDPISSTQNLTHEVVRQRTGATVTEEVEVTVTQSATRPEVVADEPDRFEAPWTMTSTDAYDRDTVVIRDAVERTDIPQVWTGQKVVFSGDEFESDTYQLKRVNNNEDQDDDTIAEYEVDESETFNDEEVVVDTSLNEDIEETEGEFYLYDVSKEERVVEWTVEDQSLGATVDGSSFINLNTDDNSRVLNVSSNRAESDVVLGILDTDEGDDGVYVESEEVMSQIVNQADYDSVEMVNDTHVRVNGVETPGLDVNRLELNFDDREPSVYDVEMDVADTEASETVQLETDFGPETDAEFGQKVYNQNQGDVVKMNITLENTDDARFKFSDENYEYNFTVDTDSGVNEVTVMFDTYRADALNTPQYEPNDVFMLSEEDRRNGARLTDFEAEEEATDIPRVFETGIYTVSMSVDDEEKDIATMYLEDRGVEEVNTHVLPFDTRGEVNLEKLQDENVTTEKDTVAMEDLLVVEVEASGIYSQTLLTESTDPEALRDNGDMSNALSEMNLSVEEINPETHEERRNITLDEARNLVVDEENNTFYVVWDTDDEDLELDGDRQYRATFHVTEDHKMVDNNDAVENNTAEHEFDLVEREVIPQLSTVTVDEENLDTRFVLPTTDNFTLESDTEIAPGTDISVRLRSEQEEEDNLPYLFRTEMEVADNGTLNPMFNLSNVSESKDFEIVYLNVNSESAVTQQPLQPPAVEEINIEQTPAVAGEETEFTAEVDHERPDTLRYEWSFEGADESSLQNPVVVYDETGTYNATVTVRDAEDQTDTLTRTVVVEQAPNQAPQIQEVVGPESVSVGQEVQYGVVASDDGAAEDLEYSWSFGDGTTAEGLSVSKTWQESGSFDVEVEVSDAEGEFARQSLGVQVGDGSQPDDNGTDPGNETFDLTVTVGDNSSDQLVSNAQVTVTDQEDGTTVFQGTTDESGLARPSVESGNYNVEVTAEGFNNQSQAVQVDGSSETVQIQLEPQQPDQPGFGIVVAILAVISIGAASYARKEL